jgi:hypothetical protein
VPDLVKRLHALRDSIATGCTQSELMADVEVAISAAERQAKRLTVEVKLDSEHIRGVIDQMVDEHMRALPDRIAILTD